MKQTFIITVCLILLIHPVKSQSTDSLGKLAGMSFPAWYSFGQEQRATAIVTRVANAMAYHKKLLNYEPVINVMVLDTKDWVIYTANQVVYGMPHYDNKTKTLIIAAEDNPFWRSFLPPPDKLPAGLRAPIQSAYTNAQGILTTQAFFDLLAIHELGHAFHNQGGLRMQRKWMAELYANILLHTYIAEKEPALLPALTLFPQMVVAGGSRDFKYTSLQDVQEHYNELGMKYPRNYGWYQCRWHMAAQHIYDTSGKEACKKLWIAFKQQKEILNEEELILFFDKTGNKAIADMIKNWDNDTH